jgi:hypothetical protein
MNSCDLQRPVFADALAVRSVAISGLMQLMYSMQPPALTRLLRFAHLFYRHHTFHPVTIRWKDTQFYALRCWAGSEPHH